MKIVVNYSNFVVHIEVKTKSYYKFLNLIFQFIKNTKWLHGLYYLQTPKPGPIFRINDCRI